MLLIIQIIWTVNIKIVALLLSVYIVLKIFFCKKIYDTYLLNFHRFHFLWAKCEKRIPLTKCLCYIIIKKYLYIYKEIVFKKLSEFKYKVIFKIT